MFEPNHAAARRLPVITRRLHVHAAAHFVMNRLTTVVLLGSIGAGLVALTRPASAQDKKSTFDGVYADAQAARGEAASTNSCSACHGGKLEGSDIGPGLQGADFRANWSGRTLGELYDKIKTTMPANEPGTLSAAATADLVAFILKLNEYPAGAAELPADPAALQQIALRHQK
jgi:mono/diheme cytochrome c family protein